MKTLFEIPGKIKVVLLITAFLIIFFPTVIIGIDSFFYRDFGVLAYPIIFNTKQSIPELPLWNPLSHCGVPFLAQWGTMTLYPFSLIYLCLPLPLSLNLFCLLHLILGGVGMYFISRRWIGGELPSMISAIGYVFNGTVLSCLMWPNYTAALGWLPWVVYAAELALEKGGKYLIYAIILSAIQYLTGVPELLLITQIILFCILILNFDRTKFFRYLLILIIPIALCLVQLLPFIDLYLHSQRQTGIDIHKWAMPGWGWANFIVPLFHYFETYQHTFTQTNQAFITSYYYPLGLIFLAVFSLFKIKNKRVLLLVFLTVLSLILSLGTDGYLFNSLSSHLPLFDKIRYPVKFILLTSFTIPLLAGFGSTFCEEKRFGVKALIICFILLAAAGCILWFNYNYPFSYDQFGLTVKNTIIRFLILFLFIIVLAISGKNKKPLFYLALFLLCFDAVKHIPNFHPKLPSEHFTNSLWESAVRSKKPTINEGRVFISREAEEKLLKSTVSDWSVNFTGKRLALWSNLNLLEQIPKVNGALTLQIKYQKEIENLLYSQPYTNIANVLRFLSVKWITKPGTVVEWIEFTNSLPIVTAGQKVVVIADNEITNRIFSTDFDPATTVFISDSKLTQSETNVSKTDIRIIKSHISNHKVVAEYESQSRSVLVISQSYYPLWTAYIDNIKVPLLRANYAFQAVLIPPGRHIVTVNYEDNYFLIGYIISAVLLIFIFIGIKSLKNKRL